MATTTSSKNRKLPLGTGRQNCRTVTKNAANENDYRPQEYQSGSERKTMDNRREITDMERELKYLEGKIRNNKLRFGNPEADEEDKNKEQQEEVWVMEGKSQREIIRMKKDICREEYTKVQEQRRNEEMRDRMTQVEERRRIRREKLGIFEAEVRWLVPDTTPYPSWYHTWY